MEEPIKIDRSALDTISNVVCLICLLGVSLYLLIFWDAIPAQVPAHYNAAGIVDRWNGKSSLIILPGLSWALFVFISLIERTPQIWNTGVRVTKENRAEVYRVLKNMIDVVKMLILLIFGTLTMFTALGRNLPSWFLLVALLLLAFVVMRFIARLFRISREVH